MEEYLTYIEKTEQDQLQQGTLCPVASGSLLAANSGKLAYAHSCHAAVEGSPTPLVESAKLKAGGVPDSHWYTCLCRTKEYSLCLNHGKIFSHKVKSPTQAVWALYLLKGSVSGPKPSLMWSSQGGKRTCRRLPFPTVVQLSFIWSLVQVSSLFLWFRSGSAFLSLQDSFPMFKAIVTTYYIVETISLSQVESGLNTRSFELLLLLGFSKTLNWDYCKK